MYKVMHMFADLQDNSYIYHEGDVFPRDGVQPSEKRIYELSSKYNLQGKPLIGYVEDDFHEVQEKNSNEYHKKYTKTEINRLSTADLKELAKKNGIEDVKNTSGANLKKILIEKFGL